MKKYGATIALLLFAQMTIAQVEIGQFGKGIKIHGKDSTYYLRFGFRFQNLFTNEWDVDGGELTNHDAHFLVRRARLKFDGFAYSPRLKYKFELGLTNRDIGGGGTLREFRNASNVVLDAFIEWNFYKNFTLRVGQSKLPGNRERVISSGNLQFVDRSRLNSLYNIDRDVGFHIKHHHNISKNFVVREVFAFSQGEGRNVTAGNFEGFNYSFRLEFLPFGTFASSGDYVGSAIKYESSPKLSVGLTYDINDNAVRERGQLGGFIKDESGNYFGKPLRVFFADFMYKHKGFSAMGEFAYKAADDDQPLVFDNNNNLIGTYFTGTGLSLQAGYMLPSNWEISGRYTQISPDEEVANNETEYTFGLSKFIVEHKLKVQTDLSYRSVDSSEDLLIYRLQMDIHF